MTAINGSDCGAFESLLHEIEIAERKLASFNNSQAKQNGREDDDELRFLEEEINLLKKEKPGGDVEDEGGLHYYLAVGEIEKEVKELRNVAEVTKNKIDGNKATLDSLESMLRDQREVVSSLEKELGTDTEKKSSTEDEKVEKMKEQIYLNKLILNDLKASFRDLLNSQMRTEHESGSDGLSLVLGTLWKNFVVGGPEAAVTDLDHLGSQVDSECLEQLSSAGIIKQEGNQLRLVDFSSE